MDFGIASYAAVSVLAFIVGYAWKTADKLNDKWIPTVCMVFGTILGIVAFLIKIPDFPANDILNAAAVGAVSGLAATGAHQIYKQLTKDKVVDPGVVVNDEPIPEELKTSETASSEGEGVTEEAVVDEQKAEEATANTEEK